MILQADGGHYLTQSADVPIDERVFGNTAYISDPSEASKYRQVSEAEKERMLNAGTILDPSDLSDEYLGKVDTLHEIIKENINTAGLTVEESLKHKEYFPKWDKLIGKTEPIGFMFSYEDTLYEVIQEHEFASQWVPGVGTESLYKVVQIEASGTKEDPIA